ncbi:MAG: WbuC family cupin fold metalloprotein [Desulfovibrionaceae bacterium]|nr:WbuC family cupin fold metalloprotein [Desulfovibrionaceae bacterium]
MKFTIVNDEVLFTDETVTTLDATDMEKLVGMASENQRQRVRLCTHRGTDDPLHEMFIIHGRDAYVRPHRHVRKDESFQVLSGEADIVFFADGGEVGEVVHLGDYASGLPFYCRIPCGAMHMVIIRSKVLVFCEATPGPFIREEMEFASWAPEDGADGVWEFVEGVNKVIEAKR